MTLPGLEAQSKRRSRSTLDPPEGFSRHLRLQAPRDIDGLDIQSTRTLDHDYDFVRVVLATVPGSLQEQFQLDAQFIEVTDGPEFLTDLLKALRDGLTEPGLLGWECKDGTLQAKAVMFLWHDESLRELFEQVSEAGVDRVQELMENWGGMKVEKSGNKWIVAGQGDGWVLKREYATKWRAELALRIWNEGGRVSDYWAAAREEKEKRSAIAQEQAYEAARRHFESARRRYPGGAVIDPDQLITVRRQPSEWRALQIPSGQLRDFHMRQSSGGVGAVSLHFSLYARMWCTDIPEDVEFGHSCRHGPPPHEILVVINHKDKQEIHDQLLSLARF